MMAPSGASEPGEGSWIDRWINPSNPRELEDEAGTSASGTTRPRPSSPLSPLPSISSRGDSWISEAYGDRGDTSPHPNPEQVNEAPVAPEKSALDERKEELLLENIKGDGQRISSVRKAVEADFHIQTGIWTYRGYEKGSGLLSLAFWREPAYEFRARLGIKSKGLADVPWDFFISSLVCFGLAFFRGEVRSDSKVRSLCGATARWTTHLKHGISHW